MSLTTIPVPMSRELTTEEFYGLIDNMVGTRDQHSVAKAFNLGQSSVSNFMRGTAISVRSSNKIAAAWNSFVETGSAPKDTGLIDDEDDGTRPYVTVNMVRERDTGRMFREDQVSTGLIGLTGGRVESDDEVVERISGRFDVMTHIVQRMLRKKATSMIVQAAPGVGKTFRIEKMLRTHKQATKGFYHKVLSGGGVSAFALYKALHTAATGGVVVLDDNDSFLDADETLNMLKNALDSSDVRTLTWSKRNGEVYCPLIMREKAVRIAEKEAKEATENAGKTKDGNKPRTADEVYDEQTHGLIPDEFEFNGAMIFITNLNFQQIAESGSSRSTHVSAMIDRSWFVNLTINNLRDKVLWCTHVFRTAMSGALTPEQTDDTVEFVQDNATKFFILSLRLFKDIASLQGDDDAGDWRNIVEATKFRV
jgi:hypothetical protein